MLWACMPAIAYMFAHLLLSGLAKKFFGSWIDEEIELGTAVSCILAPCIIYWYSRSNRLQNMQTRKKSGMFFDCAALSLSIAVFSVPLCQNEAGKCELLSLSGLNYLGVAVAGPICEELVYRGFMLSRAAKVFGVHKAIIIDGLMFGIAHAGVPQMAMAAAVGMILSLLRIKYESIFPAIIVHVLINSLSFYSEIYQPWWPFYLVSFIYITAFVKSATHSFVKR